jgi:predicted site-specific integrase-resolvase
MRLLKPEEVGYLISCSRATVDRQVSSGKLPSVTLHRGKKKRSYRVRGADIEKVFGIPMKEIEAYVEAQDRRNGEQKRAGRMSVRTDNSHGNGAADEQEARE